jgi:hypothetical protein
VPPTQSVVLDSDLPVGLTVQFSRLAGVVSSTSPAPCTCTVTVQAFAAAGAESITATKIGITSLR